MSAPNSFPLSFNDIHIDGDKVFVTSTPTSNKFEDQGAAYILVGKQWYGGVLSIPTISVTAHPLPLVLGINRQVGRFSPKDSAFFYETLLESEETDSLLLGPPSEITTIGDHAYVCGMSRSVHKCLDRNRWVRIDHDVRDTSDAIKGFRSIDGFAEDDIYAAGWGGEIWHYNGNRWRQIDSPTNVTLNKLICAKDGKVYIAGDAGFLLVGRDESWNIYTIPHEKDDLYAVAYFKNEVYVSGTDRLYILKGNRLKPVKIQSKQPIEYGPNQAFGMLAATDEVMWCGGNKCLMFTHDGHWWEEVPNYDLPGLDEIMDDDDD